MIMVEPTPNNRRVYNQLCELDDAYQKASLEMRESIIAEAKALCEKLEV